MSADGAETDAATRFLRRVRRVILFVALASVLYAAARFDVVRLPQHARIRGSLGNSRDDRRAFARAGR
jgi:hypothetical protein